MWRKHLAATAAHMPVVSRILAAVFGGYGLAALVSVAALRLPLSATEAVMAGMLASFLFWAGAVIWVFAVASAGRAWGGILVLGLPLLWLCKAVWRGAAG